LDLERWRNCDSSHHDGDGDACLEGGSVAVHCKACGESSSDDPKVYTDRCCTDVLVYSSCRDQLEGDAASSVTKRSGRGQLDDYNDEAELLDAEKRRMPFLGKRVKPFLGKRGVRPFLGKRRTHAPFLGKRGHHLDEVSEDKRRMPFLG